MSIGPVMMDLRGVEIAADEKEMLNHPLVGGLILFTRNFESPDQLQQLVTDIHAASENRILVCVDHEGGRVQRFREGFTRLPACGCIEQYDHEKRVEHAETLAWLMAVECLAIGIDFSFAPVLDLNLGVSDVIGDRAFHREPNEVVSLASAYIKGMHRAGMASTGKHFPGHGSVKADSHIAIPIDERDLFDIKMRDLIPFRRLIDEGIAAMMPAHVIFPKVDDKPAGFSKIWIEQILRQELRFQGAVFSDDLSMEGAKVAGSFAERATTALEAGCDMVLVCNDTEAAASVLDELDVTTQPQSQVRLMRMQGRGNYTKESLQANPEWQTAKALAAKMLEMDKTPDFDFD